jgi:hypothetical protein
MGEKREKDVENLKKENKYLPLPSVSRHAPQILHAPPLSFVVMQIFSRTGPWALLYAIHTSGLTVAPP